MNCVKCGGKTKIKYANEYKGVVSRARVCKTCGTIMHTREELVVEFVKKDYCSGDNCLTCKYTVCMEDRRDHTSAERRTG